MRKIWLLAAAGWCFGGSGEAPAADPSGLANVPGSVVYWRTSPLTQFFVSDRIYTTSPSIVVLPGGDYLISFNLFGASLEPPASASGTTLIFRSADKGASWTEIPSSPVMDMKRGSLFVHEGEVYLWGYQSDDGPPRIMKSVDGGLTWSAPVQLAPDPRGGTPMNPVFHRNENGLLRLWLAMGGRRMMSARADRDLLDPANWAPVGSSAGLAELPAFPSGTWDIISEAQIVASPEQGVVVLPKVQFKNTRPPYFARTVLLRRAPGSTNKLQTPGPEEWVDLPGADKKFAAAHDPVSGRFYVLSNPVLPAHSGHHEPWNLIRNTAALLSSEDLVHWDVVRLFLYTPNIGHEAFQYFNFDIDGNDLVVASRTAFDLTGEPGVKHRPPRGHDSNLITFHRIGNFRTAAPDYYLEIDNGRVGRHERTGHAPAPLGNFILGTEFEGAPLREADGLAPGPDGGVLVRERGGRVQRFDRLGNFLGTGSAEGIRFESRLDVAPPSPGECGWTFAGSGDWDDLHNWFYWNRPDTVREVACFGSAITCASTVTWHRTRTIRGLRFHSPHSYTIRGRGTLTLGATPNAPADGTPAAVIEVVQGSHIIQLPVRLETAATITAYTGAGLLLSGGLDLAGQTAYLDGVGAITVGGGLSMNGGTLVLTGTKGLRLASGSTNHLGGTLRWDPEKPPAFRPGETFTLLPEIGSTKVEGNFEQVILPKLPVGLRWDAERLYTMGSITIVPAAESSGPVRDFPG
jgi:hypothetical protein